MPSSQPTTQITVRLPTDLVEWLDEQVAEEQVPSRAAGVTKALRRQRRRQQAERDIAIMLMDSRDPDQETRLEWMRTRDYPDMGEPASVIEFAEVDRDVDLSEPPRPDTPTPKSGEGRGRPNADANVTARTRSRVDG